MMVPQYSGKFLSLVKLNEQPRVLQAAELNFSHSISLGISSATDACQLSRLNYCEELQKRLRSTRSKNHAHDKGLAPLSIQRALHPPQFLLLDRPPWQGPVSFRETVHDHCTSGLPISEGADVSLACSRAIRTIDVVQCSFQCILAVNEKLHKKNMCMQYIIYIYIE